MANVAIVCDAMARSWGAERVVEALAEAFPDAPVFTVLYDRKRGPRAIAPRVVQSWLSKIPGSVHLGRALVPLYPHAIERFDLRAFDIIISSDHTLAKGIVRSVKQTHVCYCHAPMRSLWEQAPEEIARSPLALRPLLHQLVRRLRAWDFEAAARVDRFVAKSEPTAARIRRHYRRSSTVVHPPIDTERFTPGGPVRDFYLIAARNAPYKRIDLALAAAEQLRRRLIVVGDQTDRLATGSPFITFMGKVSNEKLAALMREARALLVPQREDFAMTVLEANACGRPVVAYAGGGASEIVVDGVTGVVFHEQSVDALAAAMLRCESLPFESARLRRHAERFSKERFIRDIRRLVAEAHTRQRAPASSEPPALGHAAGGPFAFGGIAGSST